jgi:hypothetical protein
MPFTVTDTWVALEEVETVDAYGKKRVVGAYAHETEYWESLPLWLWRTT